GGSNLVKLPNVYTLSGYSNSTPNRSIILDDINGTQSILNNVPQFTDNNYLLTKNANNKYNYIHPVKFENSKIKSGIFRRAYFDGCEISNDDFKINTSITPSSRILILTDSIFG